MPRKTPTARTLRIAPPAPKQKPSALQNCWVTHNARVDLYTDDGTINIEVETYTEPSSNDYACFLLAHSLPGEQRSFQGGKRDVLIPIRQLRAFLAGLTRAVDQLEEAGVLPPQTPVAPARPDR